jgi:cell division septation protein DedD
MNGESKPKVTMSQIIWIAACVVLLTSLFLIGAWLFKPSNEGGPAGKTGPGTVTEQEVNAAAFTPEGKGPSSPQALPPPPQTPPPSNAIIPTPSALASRVPSQTASQAASPQPQAPAAIVSTPIIAASKPPSTTPKPLEPEVTPAPKPEPKSPAKASEKPKPEPRAEPKEPVIAKGDWYLQVAAVSDKKRAVELQSQLKEKGFPSAPLVHEGTLFKVRIPYKDEGGARAAKKKLDGAAIKGTEGAFVVKPEK